MAGGVSALSSFWFVSCERQRFLLLQGFPRFPGQRAVFIADATISNVSSLLSSGPCLRQRARLRRRQACAMNTNRSAWRGPNSKSLCALHLGGDMTMVTTAKRRRGYVILARYRTAVPTGKYLVRSRLLLSKRGSSATEKIILRIIMKCKNLCQVSMGLNTDSPRQQGLGTICVLWSQFAR